MYVTSPPVHVLYSTVGVELWNEWDSTMYEWLNIVFPSSCVSMCRCWLSPRLQDRTIWGFVVPAALIIIVSLWHQTLCTCILYADLLSHSVCSSSPRSLHSHTLTLVTTLTLTYSHSRHYTHTQVPCITACLCSGSLPAHVNFCIAPADQLGVPGDGRGTGVQESEELCR